MFNGQMTFVIALTLVILSSLGCASNRPTIDVAPGWAVTSADGQLTATQSPPANEVNAWPACQMASNGDACESFAASYPNSIWLPAAQVKIEQYQQSKATQKAIEVGLLEGERGRMTCFHQCRSIQPSVFEPHRTFPEGVLALAGYTYHAWDLNVVTVDMQIWVWKGVSVFANVVR